MRAIGSWLIFALCATLIGCFEDKQTLILNRDGSGRYERGMNLNRQALAFMRIAASPTSGADPISAALGRAMRGDESAVRSAVQAVAGARLVDFRRDDAPTGATISYAVEFSDIYAFLESEFARETLGLRLTTKDGSVLLEGQAARGLSGGAFPPEGVLSDFQRQLGANDPKEVVEFLAQLTGNPRFALTLVLPGKVLETTGSADGNRVEYNYSMSEAIGEAALGEGLAIRAVADASGVSFALRDMAPLPPPAMPSGGQYVPPPSPANQPPQPFDGEARVVPVGVQVQRAIAVPETRDGVRWLDALSGGGSSHGTKIAMALHVPTGGILKLDERASRLTRLVDDTGRDLLAESKPVAYFQPQAIRGAWRTQGPKREYLAVFVGATSFPDPKARSLSAAGAISVKRAGGSKTYDHTFRLDQESENFTLGDVTFHWKPNQEAAPPGGRAGVLTTTAAPGMIELVLDTQFTDEQGQRISHSDMGRNGQYGDIEKMEQTYGLDTTANTARMTVTMLTDVARISLPFDVTASLSGEGLGGDLPDITTLPAQQFGGGEAPAPLSPQDVDAIRQCWGNLEKVRDAVARYRAEKGDLPNWLSDLVPDYLDESVLLCPANALGAPPESHGISDPKMKTSYLYEFNPMPSPGGTLPPGFEGMEADTWRASKLLQAQAFGDMVPVVRCWHHPVVLNVSYGGYLYLSGSNWEDDTATVRKDWSAPTSFEPPSPLVGKPAPDFAFKNLDGETVRLSELKGKAVMLDFWATWCGPCVAAIPHVEALYKKYKDRGFVVLGLDNEREHDKVRAFAEANMTYPVLLDADEAFKTYGIQGIPTTFFIDREGIVQSMEVGFGPGMEVGMEANIRAIVEGSQPEFAEAKPREKVQVPPRPSEADSSLIDLSNHYNQSLSGDWHGTPGNTLADLPPGIHTLDGVRFDARGVVQLRGSEPGVAEFPGRIEKIPVNRAFQRLHLLQAAGFETSDGTHIASYLIHYADGSQIEAYVVYGEHVRDWWAYGEREALAPTLGTIAWKDAASSTTSEQDRRLFHNVWVNPYPDRVVSHIDIVSTVRQSALFLVAMTVDDEQGAGAAERRSGPPTLYPELLVREVVSR